MVVGRWSYERGGRTKGVFMKENVQATKKWS